MDKVTVKFVKLSETAIVPEYKTTGAAGMDLSADMDVELAPGKRCLVKTGIAIILPEGYEAQVRPRSGLALKQGITCLNSPGTVDSDYRGDVGVILVNHSDVTVKVSKGDRIAQLIVAKVSRAELIQVKTLDQTDRGENGFGSTGIK